MEKAATRLKRMKASGVKRGTRKVLGLVKHLPKAGVVAGGLVAGGTVGGALAIRNRRNKRKEDAWRKYSEEHRRKNR